MAEEHPTLEMRSLKKYFRTPKRVLRTVGGVSSSIQRGETLGIVDKGGCGKSATGRTILRLLEPISDEMFSEGRNILGLSEDEMCQMRQKMQIISQDPYSSLNPHMTINDITAEPLRLYRLCPGSVDCEKRVERIMETVGLVERLINSYPHELDGGRRQRVGIVCALVLRSSFIVCDEPVSALDVSIQAQILSLMQDLQEQLHLTYIFITHNLLVVNHLVGEIAVMYLSQVVERALAVEPFEYPQHPYTKALLLATPVPNSKKRTETRPLTGRISSPTNPPQTCRFASRRPYACNRCAEDVPELRHLGDEHHVAYCLCQQ